MKIVGFENIKALNIMPTECYNWVHEMLLQKDEELLPAKIHMTMPGNVFCNVMPSIIYASGVAWGGVKVVTRYPERKPSLNSKIMLFNMDSGELVAIMDGNWITAMRTGAVAAHSVIHLAKRDYHSIGVIGLGNVARASLMVLASMVQKNMDIKLLRYKNQAELFIDRFRDFGNLHFSIVDTVEELVRGTDVVISCATYFENDICADDCFAEGVLVVPVHTRGFTNCDLFFDRVFADDTSHVEHFKNFSKFKYYAEISEVVNGKSAGRQNDKERILAYNIGISIHDINFATHIYQMFMNKPEQFSMLSDVNMCDPVEKFWI